MMEGKEIKTEYVLDREVERILALLTKENRVVIRTCLHTGLRVSDVLAMRPDDLKSHTWIMERKTGKRKQVGFPGPLLADLRAVCGTEWVFPSRCDKSRHRTRQAVWKDVKRAAKAFRLPQNVGPHSFRKCYAVDLMHKYGDIAKVRKALNHSSDILTMIYAMADLQLEAKFRRRRQGHGKVV